MNNDENGHHGHHVNSPSILIRTILILVALTSLTVFLALAERAGLISMGGLSVPIALAIAGTKATFVAMYFMGLKYDGGTNALAFVASFVFLAVFLSFTFLDTGFRDVFEPGSAAPIDMQNAEQAELEARQNRLDEATVAPPLVASPDTLLLPNAPTVP